MNLGDIKAFLRDKPMQANPNQEVQKQLQETGLKQAMSGVKTPASYSVVSSQTTVALRVYNHSLNQTLMVNNEKAELASPDKHQQSLFDFEEIAKNVLRFVGGAIQSAAAKGADNDKLMELFAQARSGVAKGAKLAEKDLAGMMNEEIEQGIVNSKSLIENGIKQLEEKLLGQATSDETARVAHESVAVSSMQSGELMIRTADGDEVTISFEDFQQFELRRNAMLEQRQIQPATAELPPTPATQQQDEIADQPKEITPQEADSQTAADESGNPQVVVPSATTQSEPSKTERSEVDAPGGNRYEYFESSTLGFSVKGELDEAELKAIGDLVADASDLADDFFNGDMETAFQKALELGYDEQELTGFAMQLTRMEHIEVVKAYEDVSHFNEEVPGGEDPSRMVKPVSQYLTNMLQVMEQANEKLDRGNSFMELMAGIIARLRDGTPEEVSADVNRFNSFNQRLLDNLPSEQTE